MTQTAPLPRDQRPILIFGAPRSGTSLLSRLLDAHPRIAIPFESHLFNQWLPRCPAYGTLEKAENRITLIRDIIDFGIVHDWAPRPDPEEVLTLVRDPSFAGIATAIMAWWAQRQGKPRWGEKTPHHTLLHTEVLAAWPDALVVFIQRDPRDVTLSWKEARFGGNHVHAFARAWRRYAEACEDVRENLPEEQWITVRYEDLVRDPESVLTTLMRFLGEEFAPEQLGFHASGQNWRTDARNEARLRKPISADSIGRWREALSAREVRMIEAETGAMLARLGYEPSVPGARLPGVEQLAIRFIEHPVHRALGLLKNPRGFIYASRDIAWKLRRMTARPS